MKRRNSVSPGKVTPEKFTPKISFILNQESAKHSESDAFILPYSPKFNDFGHYTSCLIGLRIKNDDVEWFEAKCAVQGENNTHGFLKAFMPSESAEYPASELPKPFRTLLVDAKSYGLVRRLVGTQKGRAILSALQDVAIQKARFYKDWPDFFDEPIFTHAIIRSSETYFSYRKGERFLRGLRDIDAEARSEFSVELTGDGPKVGFSFKFDKDNFLRGRIAVIIGQNGCGKTSALAKLSKVMADKESKSGLIFNKPDINQVLAFIHTASVKQFSPSSLEGSANVRVFTFNPAMPRKHTDDPITKLLVDVARGHDAQGALLQHFSEVIQEEFCGLKLYIPIRSQSGEVFSSKEAEYIEFEKWASGGEEKRLRNAAAVHSRLPIIFRDSDEKIRSLSLGQLSFLRFILTALSNAGPGSLFVIDEPENFLHPNLVSRFMRSLNKILNGTQSIAIIATHSPFVVREVQSAQVHVMRTIDGRTVVSKPLMQTLGANVTSISNEVFGDDLPNHLYEELLDLAKDKVSTFDEVLDRFSSDLSVEAMMSLRRKMEGKQ